VLYVIDQLTALGGGERALIRIIRAHSTRFRSAVLTFREDIHPQVRKCVSVPVHVIPLVRTCSVNGLFAGLRLWRLIRAEHIDIVHTFFETSDLFGGLIAKLSGVKVLISSRRDMGLLRVRKHKVAYRLVGRLCSRVLTVSDAVRNWVLASDRLSPDQVTTLYTGIHVTQWPPDRAPQKAWNNTAIPHGAPVILSVANILPWKGHEEFLRAAALVHRRVPEAQFLVAGAPSDSALLSSLLALRSALGLCDCFHFLGESESVSSLYRRASVFCLLSRTEGLPNVVLEAMAAGVPVVATNAGGTGEIITHGSTGFLTAIGDVEDAAQHICSVLLSPNLAGEISDSARNRLESVFSLERMMTSLEGIYESSLARQ
jgi:glycosyltransferase involved in cell wall biosynthesis